MRARTSARTYTGDQSSMSVDDSEYSFEGDMATLTPLVDCMLRGITLYDDSAFVQLADFLTDERDLIKLVDGLRGKLQAWQVPLMRMHLVDITNSAYLESEDFNVALLECQALCLPTMMHDYVKWVKKVCLERKSDLAVAGETMDSIIDKHEGEGATPEKVMEVLEEVRKLLPETEHGEHCHLAFDATFAPAVTEYFRQQYGFTGMISGDLVDTNLPYVIHHNAVGDVMRFLTRMTQFYHDELKLNNVKLTNALRCIVLKEFAVVAEPDKASNAKYPMCRTISYLVDFIDQTLLDELSRTEVKQLFDNFVDLPKALRAGRRVRLFEEKFPACDAPKNVHPAAPLCSPERYRVLGKRARDDVDFMIDERTLEATSCVLTSCDNESDVISYMHQLVPMIFERLDGNKELMDAVDVLAVLEDSLRYFEDKRNEENLSDAANQMMRHRKKSEVFYNYLQAQRPGSVRPVEGISQQSLAALDETSHGSQGVPSTRSQADRDKDVGRMRNVSGLTTIPQMKKLSTHKSSEKNKTLSRPSGKVEFEVESQSDGHGNDAISLQKLYNKNYAASRMLSRKSSSVTSAKMLCLDDPVANLVNVGETHHWGLLRMGAVKPIFWRELRKIWKELLQDGGSQTQWKDRPNRKMTLDEATDVALGFLTKTIDDIELRALTVLGVVKNKEDAVLAASVLAKLWQENDDPTITPLLSIAMRYLPIRQNPLCRIQRSTRRLEQRVRFGTVEKRTRTKKQLEAGATKTPCTEFEGEQLMQLLTRRHFYEDQLDSELEKQVQNSVATMLSLNSGHAETFLQWCFDLRTAFFQPRRIAFSIRVAACDYMMVLINRVIQDLPSHVEVPNVDALRQCVVALLVTRPQETDVNWRFVHELSQDLVMRAWKDSTTFNVTDPVKYCLQGVLLESWFAWIFRNDTRPNGAHLSSQTYRMVNDAFHSLISACGLRRAEALQIKIAHKDTIMDLIRASAPRDLEILAREVSLSLNFVGRLESDKARVLAIHKTTFRENKLVTTFLCLIKMVYDASTTNRLFYDSYLRCLLQSVLGCHHSSTSSSSAITATLSTRSAVSSPHSTLRLPQPAISYKSHVSWQVRQTVLRFLPLVSSFTEYQANTARVLDLASGYDRLFDHFVRFILRLLAILTSTIHTDTDPPLEIRQHRHIVRTLSARIAQLRRLLHSVAPQRQFLRTQGRTLRHELKNTVERPVPFYGVVDKRVDTEGHGKEQAA